MLGNTGSVALPITAAMGIEQGHLRPGDRVAMMGIGSGINVVILGIDWQQGQRVFPTRPRRAAARDEAFWAARVRCSADAPPARCCFAAKVRDGMFLPSSSVPARFGGRGPSSGQDRGKRAGLRSL